MKQMIMKGKYTLYAVLGVVVAIMVAALLYMQFTTPRRPTTLDGMDYPAPGEMRLLDLSTVQFDHRDLVNTNPTFNDWFAGAPSPIGFLAPRDPEQSQILRESSPEAHPDGAIVVTQVWQELDGGATVEDRFRTAPLDMRPDAPGLLEVNGTFPGDTVFCIEIHSVDQNDRIAPMPLASRIFRGEDQPVTLSLPFSPGPSGRVLASAVLLGAKELPARCRWYSWRVYTGESGGPDDVPGEPLFREIIAELDANQITVDSRSSITPATGNRWETGVHSTVELQSLPDGAILRVGVADNRLDYLTQNFGAGSDPFVPGNILLFEALARSSKPQSSAIFAWAFYEDTDPVERKEGFASHPGDDQWRWIRCALVLEDRPLRNVQFRIGAMGPEGLTEIRNARALVFRP